MRDAQEPSLDGRMQGRGGRSVRNELARDAKTRAGRHLGACGGMGRSAVSCQPCAAMGPIVSPV